MAKALLLFAVNFLTAWLLAERWSGELMTVPTTAGASFGSDAIDGHFEEDIGNVPFEAGDELEIDLLGDIITEERAVAQSAHADWEERNSDFRLNVGKKWGVISSVRADTPAAGIGYYRGNIGFRRTQFRAMRSAAFSDSALVTLQGSLSQDGVTNLPSDRFVRGELSDWPWIQGHVGLTFCIAVPTSHQSSWVLQTTSALGFLEVSPPLLDFSPGSDACLEAYSVNVEFGVPVCDWIGFQGEFFARSNLTSFGKLGQGVGSRSIRSTGGWCEIWCDWTPHWHSNAGGGINDVVDPDGLHGRTQNAFIYVTLSFDVTNQLVTGMELSWRDTVYHDSRLGQLTTDQLTPSEPSRTFVINWMISYSL